ncbi:MAG: hypothetical protein ACFN1E_04715 [Prevotella melaninogenica]|jgi:hypothetical protein bfra3_16293
MEKTVETSKMVKRYIHIKKEDRDFLMTTFGITEKSVFNAINFDSKRGNTELAKRIRKLAIDRGGIVMIEAPEGEIFHDSDNYMREYLPGGVMIELSKRDGSGVVFKKGMQMKSYENILLTDIPQIQAYAAGLK